MLLSVAILVVGLLIPAAPGVDGRLQVLFAVFLATVVLWITRPIPYTISSILCVVLISVTGVTDTFGAAVQGFASTLLFFFILLLLLGKSIAAVDLDEWIANRLVTESSTPNASMRRVASSIFLLALLMPSSTARTVTFMPIIDRINGLYDLDGGSDFRRTAYYTIGHVNPIGSTALMTGGGMSIATAEIISRTVRPITWVEWAFYMLPPVAIVFLLTTVIVGRLHGIDDTVALRDAAADGGSDPGSGEAERAREPLDGDQQIVLGTLILAILGWVVGSFVDVPAILPALFVVVVLTLPGVGILDAQDLRDINWGVVFLFGTMLSILEVMNDLDGLELLVDLLFAGVPAGVHPAVLVALLFAGSVLVRSLFSSVAATILILLPVQLEVVASVGIEGLYLSFGLLLILVSTTLLPFNISTALLAYERGPLSGREVFLLGLTTVGIGAMVIVGSWLLYWPMIDVVVGRLF